jgi:hypothetical protein
MQLSGRGGSERKKESSFTGGAYHRGGTLTTSKLQVRFDLE